MASKMGVREFRDSFTSIARDATETVIVTNHDKIVGWFTPAKVPPLSARDFLAGLKKIRRGVEARGIDVEARLKRLGLDDETMMSGESSINARKIKRKSKGKPRRPK